MTGWVDVVGCLYVQLGSILNISLFLGEIFK